VSTHSRWQGDALSTPTPIKFQPSSHTWLAREVIYLVHRLAAPFVDRSMCASITVIMNLKNSLLSVGLWWFNFPSNAVAEAGSDLPQLIGCTLTFTTTYILTRLIETKWRSVSFDERSIIYSFHTVKLLLNARSQKHFLKQQRVARVPAIH